jgi:hypothetical protein
LFRSFILNSHHSCQKRLHFSAPYHIPGRSITHTKMFCQSHPS